MTEIPGTVQPNQLDQQTGSVEAAEVECPICYQEYNQGGKCPRMLECLHVFCTECLQRIQLSPTQPPDPHSPPSISCPLCRHPTPLEMGDALSLPCNSRILAQLPPLAFRMPVSVSTRLTTITQRVVLSLESRDARFIILPTVSLRVEQMGTGEEHRPPAPSAGSLEVQQEQRRALVCVQLLALIFWILFVLTCVVGVVFGPNFFHN
ncbi:RING finger domain-containing protein [Anguilla rostrata]|uniref:RING finger protein 223 n=1 Tax=Anguilla anguilla TaxID=7936 RepID=UPI0015A9E508|nr:RING finger protein 223 [Anguilla anguilla]